MVPTGDRARRYGLGEDILSAQRRVPVGSIVVAAPPGAAAPSTTEAAVRRRRGGGGTPATPARLDRL